MKEGVKEFNIRLVCRDDLLQAEVYSFGKASKGRGMKKSFIREGHWHFIMDVVKNKLLGSSRALDIAFP